MKRLLLLLLLYPACLPTQAEKYQRPGNEDKFGFYLTRNRSRTCIPFEFRSNLLIIAVRINGTDSARFIIDTGVGHTLITDPSVLTNGSLKVARRVTLGGAGGGHHQMASVAIDNSLTIGSLRIEHHNLIILDKNVLTLSEYAGTPIHGIIGYELFANLVVTIDFEHREISVVQPQNYRYHRRKGDQYSITIRDRKAYSDALSVFDGHRFQPLRVVLDTGAGQALLLDRSRCGATIPLPSRVARMPLGRGLNGLLTGSVGRFEQVRFGRSQFSNLLVSFPDSTDFIFSLPGPSPRQGNVGCELLRRFRVTFHYQAGYLVLKPVRRLVREAFEQDMSGLELRARGAQFHHYYVDSVLANSPAERAGLRAGDELLSVNRHEANALNIGGIYQMLQAGEGRKINVVACRNGQLFSAQFTLKRFI